MIGAAEIKILEGALSAAKRKATSDLAAITAANTPSLRDVALGVFKLIPSKTALIYVPEDIAEVSKTLNWDAAFKSQTPAIVMWADVVTRALKRRATPISMPPSIGAPGAAYARMTAMPAQLPVLLSPAIAAQNDLNMALAKNMNEAASIADLNKTMQGANFTDAQIGTLLQLDYLRLYEGATYDAVVKAAATANGGQLGGLLSKISKAFVSAVTFAFDPTGHLASATYRVASQLTTDLKNSNQWLTVVFPVPTLALSFSKIAGNAANAAVHDSIPYLQKLVVLSPAILVSKAIVPDAIYQAAKKFENEHRAEIKIAGAIAAVVTGVALTNPQLLTNLASLAQEAAATAYVNIVPAAQTLTTTAATNYAVGAVSAAVPIPPGAQAAVASAVSATVASGLGAVYSGTVPNINITPASVLASLRDKLPGAAALGEDIGGKINAYIEKVGPDKVKAVIDKYTAGGPITSDKDPRYSAMTADLAALATEGVPTLGASAATVGGVDLKALIVPALAVATFIFK